MATQAYLFPTDIVEAILAELGKEIIPTDRDCLHNYIYQCKDDHPDLLESFIFDELGGVVRSKILEDALTNLEISSLLGQKNPDFSIYEIKPELKSHYKKYIEVNITKEALSEIKEISKGLAEMIDDWGKEA